MSVARIPPAFGLLLLLPSLVSAGDFERGVEALEQRNYDLAIVSFTAHLREKPTDAAAYYDRGYAHAAQREYERAIADYTEALTLYPEHAAAYYNRGNAYAAKGEC